MSKRFNSINGSDFTQMVLLGAQYLNGKVNMVNSLNVFPVPDGDTGSNMNMTLMSGVEELKKKTSSHIGRSSEALSKGLLMGARGNSGVILSQLFRGLAKSIAEREEIDAVQFASGLQNGVDTAYRAVVKPVEGTILTVAKEAAKHAAHVAKRNIDVLELMHEVLNKAKEALAKTPDQLPVLKQVGVVDAGGQGLVLIYEGFIAALQGNGNHTEQPDHLDVVTIEGSSPVAQIPVPITNLHNQAMHLSHNVQAQLSTEDIEFGYCTEFIIQLAGDKSSEHAFDESDFRSKLEKHGDSVLVVADDDLVKVHLHAEQPGNVLTLAQRYGELIKIKIENMREQHSHLLSDTEIVNNSVVQASEQTDEELQVEIVPYGFVAVAIGDGIGAILESLGTDVVLSGGQTMNPSTEDIVRAVEQVSAHTVFVLPNNSNIIMAAQQAKELVEKDVIVIPSKTIPQGMSALIAFQEHSNMEQNTEAMLRAIASVQSGQVTYAVRDSHIDGVDIKQGDFLGILNNQIVASTPSLLITCQKLIESMSSDGAEMITILSGEEAPGQTTRELVNWLGQEFPDAEVEEHDGGQPLYYYLFAVE